MGTSEEISFVRPGGLIRFPGSRMDSFKYDKLGQILLREKLSSLGAQNAHRANKNDFVRDPRILYSEIRGYDTMEHTV